MKRKKKIVLLLIIVLAVALFFPTWTPRIAGKNGISELRKVDINGEKIQVMIRGCDRNNPILLFVHGGPCWSEIPYVVKYQKEWEEKFTVVHYDQRGSGKSYQFFKDYSDVLADTHMEDLVALTEYVTEYLGQEQVILAGHSYGTYIATNAAAQRPDLYQAYIGIGQVSDKTESELLSLNKCIEAAEAAGKTSDAEYLKSLEASIQNGEMITPRQYVRKYGFAARKIDDNLDYLQGFLLRPEYNLSDVLRLYTAAILYQDGLLQYSTDNPIEELVTEMEVPIYFVMGKYDGMTSPESAEGYLNCITSQQEKEFVLFEESAHFPQFEERALFYDWLCETFTQE